MHIHFTAMLTRDGVFFWKRNDIVRRVVTREQINGKKRRRKTLVERIGTWRRLEFAFRQDRRYQKNFFPPVITSSSSSSSSSSTPTTSTHRRWLQKDTMERNGAFDIGHAKCNPNDILPKHFANRSRMFSGGQASKWNSLARPSTVLRLALLAQYFQIRKPRSPTMRERHF